MNCFFATDLDLIRHDNHFFFTISLKSYEIMLMFKILGHGLFATKEFDNGKFLLEYRGQLCVDDGTANEEDNVLSFQFKQNNIKYRLVVYINIFVP